jgi:hypothetical protein
LPSFGRGRNKAHAQRSVGGTGGRNPCLTRIGAKPVNARLCDYFGVRRRVGKTSASRRTLLGAVGGINGADGGCVNAALRFEGVRWWRADGQPPRFKGAYERAGAVPAEPSPSRVRSLFAPALTLDSGTIYRSGYVRMQLGRVGCNRVRFR